ncbi:transposase [candidate division GN15 bacterium]|nr:transposase [candidate division GN15 bacterium]
MQSKRDCRQEQMVLLPPLESFIPSDHKLRKLNSVLDLSFVHETVRALYCQDNGRPSIDPEVIIRLFLLQALEGIAHVRELMRQVQVNLAYRWFIGYELDEGLPDHSTLSRCLDRFGDAVFNELFSRSVSQCKASGLIDGRVLHVDATTIRADIDANKVNQPGSSDPDARFGKFPGKRIAPGYKQHTVADGKSRVVLSSSVTPADGAESDEAVPVIDQASRHLDAPPEAVCGDAAYSSGHNAASMEDRGIRLVSPPRTPRTYTRDRYYTIEAFVYDEGQDQFTCPDGKILRYVGTGKHRRRRNYRARRSDCQRCPLKPRCTSSQRRHLKVTRHHASLVRLRADSTTESFKRLYRSRAPVIEGIFGEAKQWHGLHRAWRRGLHKMQVQCWLVAAVLNFKRLAAHFGLLLPTLRAIRHLWGVLRRLLGDYLPTTATHPKLATH